jgi:hypothetical protein
MFYVEHFENARKYLAFGDDISTAIHSPSQPFSLDRIFFQAAQKPVLATNPKSPSTKFSTKCRVLHSVKRLSQTIASR